jgi:hypothetical protein
MKTTNGFANELLSVKKAKKNWRFWCGTVFLTVLWAWGNGYVFGEVLLTPQAGGLGLGTYSRFYITGAPVNDPVAVLIGDQGMSNGGPSGDAGNRVYSWTGDNAERNLAYITGTAPLGLNVNIVTEIPGSDPAVVGETYQFANNLGGAMPSLTFSPTGGDAYFTQDLAWNNGSGPTFSVQSGGTGAVHVGGTSTLDLGNHLSVNEGATLVLDIYKSSGSTTGGIVVSSGSNNTGTIDLKGTTLTLNGNLGGSGTINIDEDAMLISNYSSNSQNIRGAHTISKLSTGLISVVDSTEFQGNLRDSIGFTGGGNAYIFSDNTGILSNLYVYNGTDRKSVV